MPEPGEKPQGRDGAVKVCFFTPYALALFDPAQSRHFGGAEVRASRFARGLAALSGFDVTCLALDAKPNTFDGVHLVPVPELIPSNRPCDLSLSDRVYLRFRDSGERIPSFPYVRFHRFHAGLFWQVPLLAANQGWKAAKSLARRLASRVIRRAPKPPEPIVSSAFAALGSDVFCVFGVNDPAAHVVASCRAYGVPTILFLASDQDLSEMNFRGSLARGPHNDSGHLCHFELTEATAIVTQTEAQRILLEERFGRDAVVIRNPLPLCSSAANASDDALAKGARSALWIGRAERANKRPELCIELARLCPDVPFTMILNPADADVFQQISDSAPANVTIIDSVPFQQIDAYFRRAAVLLNTSLREGFPNTFLQAASHGVPILSLLVDPDGFIARQGCGYVCGDDLNHMAERLRQIFPDPSLARQLGEAGRSYVRRVHDPNSRVAELAALIRAVVQGKPPQARSAAAPHRHAPIKEQSRCA